MPFKCITLNIEGGIAQLSLNRPEVHNVINDVLMSELEQALDRIERDSSVRVVIFSAAGKRVFCAGGDLKYFAKLETSEQAQAMSRRMQTIFQRIHEGHRPVITAINGSAYGGGCELITAGHYRIAIADATFQFRHADMGVVTGWGGGYRLFRLLGKAQALRLFLTGEKIDATEAKRIGLITQIVAADQLHDESLRLARCIAEKAPRSIEAFMTLAGLVDEGDKATFQKAESELFAECWTLPPFRAALARFLNRRKEQD